MKIVLSSVFVEDQNKALRFYTEVLGFVKKTDLPAGEFRWLTVVSPEGPEGVELVLEPNANAAARTYQKTIFEAGIPATAFASNDIQAEYERLVERGVVFTAKPTKTEWGTDAAFNDTCGNIIGLHQD